MDARQPTTGVAWRLLLAVVALRLGYDGAAAVAGLGGLAYASCRVQNAADRRAHTRDFQQAVECCPRPAPTSVVKGRCPAAARSSRTSPSGEARPRGPVRPVLTATSRRGSSPSRPPAEVRHPGPRRLPSNSRRPASRMMMASPTRQADAPRCRRARQRRERWWRRSTPSIEAVGGGIYDQGLLRLRGGTSHGQPRRRVPTRDRSAACATAGRLHPRRRQPHPRRQWRIRGGRRGHPT